MGRYLVGVLLLFTLAGPATAGAETPLRPDINMTEDGVALEGYDVVAYFVVGGPVRGSAEYSADYDGVTYHFASPEHRDLFLESPEKYLPAYGGFCAYGVAQNKKVGVEPDVWKIVGGRLFLNYSASVQAKWEEDLTGNIGRADLNWFDLKDKKAGGGALF